MTLAQAIEVARRRHNAESDTFWSDNELYQLITNRCNEILSYIGLLEDTATVNSAASTQAYDFPTDAVAIRQINYLNIKLKQLTFAQWDRFAVENSVTSGRPRYWVKWARQYLLVPQPDTSSETITVYYYKEHPYIDGSIQTTIDIPSVLHSHLIIGVLADMFAKDQNPNMVRYYEDRWTNYSIPAFMKFKSNEDFSQFNVPIDADTDEYADTGGDIMPQIKPVGGKYQIAIDRFDGGRNTKDAPSRINDNESPDLLNVVFDDVGSAKTREGTTYLNTSPTTTIGTNTFDGGTVYQGTMVAWAGGSMWRLSGTVFDKITTSSGRFTSGVMVAYQQFQNILFCSDGTNGPYRWEGAESFYNQGISAPSAPSSVSNGAGNIAAGTYFYKVSFLNSHAVEGDVGSASAGTTLAASAAITVNGIPVGSGLNGVEKRWIYRANSAAAAYKFVKELSDNTTTSFTDTIAVGAEGGSPISDGRAPTPYTTIKLHKEVLFWDDSSNRTLLRHSAYSNPFISPALNFIPLNEGDGSNILAVDVQQDLVSVFKANSIWVIALVDPSDATTWSRVKSPSAVGIVGARAHHMVDNAVAFVGQQNGRVSGFHLLSGVDLADTANQLVRSKSISEKIEADILGLTVAQLSKAAMYSFDNKLHVALNRTTTSARNDIVWWFDINRLGSDGQPGSWSPWTGDVGVNDWTVYNNKLYGFSSGTDGYVLQFYNGTFTDASGAGIDSYMWTKEFGGEPAIESWTKDARFLNIWYGLLGSYTMRVRWRKDGESGEGNGAVIDLTPPGDTWGSLVWGSGMWSAGGSTKESQVSVGKLLCRRIQVKFENERTGITPVANRGFQVFSLKALMNLRRQRG